MSDPFYTMVGTATQSSGLNKAGFLSPDVQPVPAATALPISGLRRWAAADDTFWGASETYDGLPAGLYRCDSHQSLGLILRRQKVDTDALLLLPDDTVSSIVEEFSIFWNREAEFRKRGFLHKRGFLLWGPPGSGKTSCMQQLVHELIKEHDGVVVFVDVPSIAGQCLRMLRHIEPKRPLIALMEDVDALVHRYGEAEFLALLDGEAQVDNIVFLATTNYPERLDRRFVDRPSRFDTVKYVGMPKPAARAAYIRAKEPDVTDAELAAWVEATEGLSLAHIKELIIAIRCFGQSLSAVSERLDNMRQKPSSEDAPDRTPVGIIGKRRSIG